MEMTKERISKRSVNYVSVYIFTENGCDPNEGEYTLHLQSFSNFLDICSLGGVDDISLIKECIEENLKSFYLPEEGATEIVLKESGEWEDVFWHKYYEVERICVLDQ